MMTEFLPSIRLGVDAAMVMLIWLVQLVIYPAFHTQEKAGFINWHHKYMRTISIIVIPLMSVQGAIVCYQLTHFPGAGTAVAAAAGLGAWLTTFICSVPCHRKLQADGKNSAVITRLIATNWMRTLAWTVVLASGPFC